MEYTVAPSEDGEYIAIDILGDIDRAGLAEVTEAFLELSGELGIGCFLIDMRDCRNVEGALANVHYTLDDVAEIATLENDVCVAVLIDPGDRSHDFAIAFAQSQGRDIRPFHVEADAIACLHEAAPVLNSAQRGTDRPS
jgi:hypothetical protein